MPYLRPISSLRQFLTLWIALFGNFVRGGFYDLYTESVLIPFDEDPNDGIPWTNNVHVSLKFSLGATKIHTPFVDTGTCGIVHSAKAVDGWETIDLDRCGDDPAVCQPGWQFLSSSDLLYSGVWIPKDVYLNFDDTAGHKLVKVHVPIFAVTGVVECKHYDVKNGNGICPPIPPSTTPIEVTPYPPGIEIFGIGFGRVGDGQPQGTPDKNPLLNVKEIKGEAPVAYWPGYIINKEGITIGLTGFNTGGMEFAKLPPRVGPGPGPPPHPYDWGELPGCVQLDASPCRPVSILLDTGIDYSNIRLPTGTVWTNRDAATQKLNYPADVRFVLGDPGAETIHFEVRSDLTVAADNEEPDYIHAYGKDGLGPFVNTGRHAYRIFVVAFDAVLGRLGFDRI